MGNKGTELLEYSCTSVCKVQAMTVVEMCWSLVQDVKAAVGVKMVQSTLLLLEWYRPVCSHQPEECVSYVNGICAWAHLEIFNRGKKLALNVSKTFSAFLPAHWRLVYSIRRANWGSVGANNANACRRYLLLPGDVCRYMHLSDCKSEIYVFYTLSAVLTHVYKRTMWS